MSKLLKDLLKQVPAEVSRYVELSDDVARHIESALQARSMTQKELAKRLGKKESEISKWLTGRHNFTIKSIAKIETALECDLVFTRSRAEEELHRVQTQLAASVDNIFSAPIVIVSNPPYNDDDFSFVMEKEAA